MSSHLAMDPSIFRYIWRYSRSSQIVVLALVLGSLPFYFLMLDLPRKIVNGPIQGRGFETPDATASFLNFSFTAPGFLQDILGAGKWTLFEGFQLERVEYLLALSTFLLGLVAINGIFKLLINTLKGRMGERTLRRLRYQLFDRVLRFPTAHVRKVRQAEVASMIKDEVEPLGGFIGDAFVQPAFLGGQAITALLFIMIQSFWLGLVAGVIVLVQALIIPKLRRRILDLGRQRQLAARHLAGRVGEVVEGALEIHAHDTSHYERAEITGRLGHIFLLRFEIYRRKFQVKFLNNTLAQFTPFIFYSVGGYFAIKGSMDIGQLVAALVAYKELPTPVKELIDWDQQRLDVQIKYESIITQFNPDGMIAPELQNPDLQEDAPLAGMLTASRVGLEDDVGLKLLDGVTFSFDVRSHVAIIGPVGGGQEYLGLLIARLIFPSSGKLTVGGRDMSLLPEAVTGRRISYAGADSILFGRSVRDNLLYALMHRPLTAPVILVDDPAREALEQVEIRRSGNSPFDLRADWIDYAASGSQGPYDIDNQIADVLDVVVMREEVYQLGLRGCINPADHASLAENVLQARGELLEMLKDPAYGAPVEPFDPERYNRNATLRENFLFGTAVGATFATASIIENDYFQDILDETGLTPDLIRMGLAIAETMIELFTDIAPGHPFFEQFSFIAADDLPEFQEIVKRAAKLGLEFLPEADRRQLAALPLDYSEARHRLGLVDQTMETRILTVRHKFSAGLPQKYRQAIEFYDPKKYNTAATLLDNILFGRVIYGQAEAQSRIGVLINDVVNQLNLRWEIFKVGLNFNVGGRGRLLSGPQRQKLALAKAILKRPDILVVSDAISLLDARSQQQIFHNVKKYSEGRGLIWIGGQLELSQDFDQILVVEDGRIAEQGSFEHLSCNGSHLPQLLAVG
jgi:putative ABC transport system ATP-binding protein